MTGKRLSENQKIWVFITVQYFSWVIRSSSRRKHRLGAWFWSAWLISSYQTHCASTVSYIGSFVSGKILKWHRKVRCDIRYGWGVSDSAFRADAPYPDLDERVVVYESKIPEVLLCKNAWHQQMKVSEDSACRPINSHAFLEWMDVFVMRRAFVRLRENIGIRDWTSRLSCWDKEKM